MDNETSSEPLREKYRHHAARISVKQKSEAYPSEALVPAVLACFIPIAAVFIWPWDVRSQYTLDDKWQAVLDGAKGAFSMNAARKSELTGASVAFFLGWLVLALLVTGVQSCCCSKRRVQTRCVWLVICYTFLLAGIKIGQMFQMAEIYKSR
jgi:hypothetical protein